MCMCNFGSSFFFFCFLVAMVKKISNTSAKQKFRGWQPSVVAEWSKTPVFSNSIRESVLLRSQVWILLGTMISIAQEVILTDILTKGLISHYSTMVMQMSKSSCVPRICTVLFLFVHFSCVYQVPCKIRHINSGWLMVFLT